MTIAVALLTLGHVLISLAGIFSGFVVLYGLFKGDRMDRWTAIFLATTIATSASGFLFPVERLLPSHVVGIISLVLLAAACFARYIRQMEGIWRPVYVVTGMLSLYLNVFVGLVQAFLKLPALKVLAPTQAEPPFAITQGAVLVVFIGLIIAATLRFRPVPAMARAAAR